MMRNSILLGFLAIVFALGLSQNSYAQCFTTGTTGDGGNIINCTFPIQTSPVNLTPNPPFAMTTVNTEEVNINAGGGVVVNGLAMGAMALSGGPDVVTTSGDLISDFGVGLGTSSGGDTVFMNGGTIRCTDPVLNGNLPASVFMGGANDFFQMNGGLIDNPTTFPAINTFQNADIIECNGGTITGALVAIEMFSGTDTLTVNGCTINGEIQMGTNNDLVTLFAGTLNVPFLRMEQGNDTVNIAGDVDTGGVIFGGGGLGDTLIFSMDVPAPQVAAVTAAINAADPASDSLVINGITYTWTTFETLVADLNAIVTTVLLTPMDAVNEILTDHTVTATVLTDGAPAVGVSGTIVVLTGPNAGAASDVEGTCSPNPDCTTDANGQVSWTYTSDGDLGTDTILARFEIPGGAESNIVEKTWVLIRNVPTLSEWGIISMAAILGIVGFMVMRRRKATA